MNDASILPPRARCGLALILAGLVLVGMAAGWLASAGLLLVLIGRGLARRAVRR